MCCLAQQVCLCCALPIPLLPNKPASSALFCLLCSLRSLRCGLLCCCPPSVCLFCSALQSIKFFQAMEASNTSCILDLEVVSAQARMWQGVPLRATKQLCQGMASSMWQGVSGSMLGAVESRVCAACACCSE